MRAGLLDDGWKEDTLLPAGWLFKMEFDDNRFINHLGERLESVEEAKRSLHDHTEEEIAAFLSFIDIQSGVRRSLKYDWKEDPALPAGWKAREVNKKSFFLSPDNHQVAGLDALLKFLIDGGCSKEEQEKVKILIAQVKAKKLDTLRQKTARSHTWEGGCIPARGLEEQNIRWKTFFPVTR